MMAAGAVHLASVVRHLIEGGTERLSVMVPIGVPVLPDAPEARRWLREELSKPPYEAAKPSWFDRLSQGLVDWFTSLSFNGTGALQNWLPVIVVAVVLAALVAGWFIFGAPKLSRRRRASENLFGTVDERSSTEMRTAAEAAASAGNWSLAVEEMFRALARGLAERTVLSVTPGTTAHDFAARARLAFPAYDTALSQAATTFDRVRYLEQAALELEYRALASLESELRGATPARLAPPVEALQS